MEAQALFPVDVQAVALDGQVLLQGGLHSQQLLESVLRLSQFGLQLIYRLKDLANLFNQPTRNEPTSGNVDDAERGVVTCVGRDLGIPRRWVCEYEC